MRTIFILLLSCVSCIAQFGVEQPMFRLASAVQGYSATNDPALAYYWNFRDINPTTVTNWPDRVQSLTWTRYNPAFGPTNDGVNGVIFTNETGKTTILTNTGILYASNTVVGVIWKGSGLIDTYAGFCRLTNEIVNGNYWLARRWSGDLGYLDWGAPAQVSWAFPIDWSKRQFTFIAWSNTYLRCYTNNVGTAPLKSMEVVWPSGDPDIHSPAIHQIGGAVDFSASQQFRGSWQELIVWTNVTGSGFEKLLTNYWQHATNTYTFP